MKAEVRLNTKRVGPPIDPRIFGHFLENMGKAIHGGGLLSRDGRARPEIVEALKELKISALRWPGGLFADGYHFSDGIGPNRTPKPNRYWRRLGPLYGRKDTNLFGTHEFLSLCETVGAEPYINANLGTGTPREAAGWVEYCNGNRGTAWGSKRASFGREEPWGVKIWGIGNESFGWWALGHSDPATYAKRYLEFQKAMTAVDPTIKPVAVGMCDLMPDWNKTLLSRIGDAAAWLSVHVYLPGNLPQYLFLRLSGTPVNHYALAAAYLELDRKLKFTSGQMTEVLGENYAMRIALDEWNLWWWFTQSYMVFWKMRDAVALAGMAGALAENCERVGMANIAQVINVLGLLQTNRDHVVRTPLFHVMRMFAQAIVGRRVETATIVETFRSKKLGGIPAASNVPFLSTHCASDGKRLGVILIQRSYDRNMTVEIDAPGVRFDRAEVLSAPSPEAVNTFKDPDLVRPRTQPVQDGNGGAVLELPPASVSALYGSVSD